MGVHIVTIQSPWYHYPSSGEQWPLLVVMLSIDLYVILCNEFYFLFCNLVLFLYVVSTISVLRGLKRRAPPLQKASTNVRLLAGTVISNGVRKYLELQVLHIYYNGIFGSAPFAYILLVMLSNHSVTLYGVVKLNSAFPVFSVLVMIQWALIAFPMTELVLFLQLGKVFEMSKGLLGGWRGMMAKNGEVGKKLRGLRAINFKCLAKFTKLTGLRFILVVSNLTKNVILAF